MLDKDAFFKEFPVEDAFRRSGLSWEKLSDIYTDYKYACYNDYQSTARNLVSYLEDEAPENARCIYGRAKNPEHLIEKIIRKAGTENSEKYRLIDKENYKTKVTDLVGIRILVLAKEEWDEIDKHIHDKFQNNFLEPPVAYVCYGDREIFDQNRILVDYTNKGYRSQHYLVEYENKKCEIQVRTLAEEVYGEYDHRVRYPYQTDNKFLHRYSKIISKSTSELDDLISTCITLNKPILDKLDVAFKEDSYIDWSKMNFSNNNIKTDDKDIENSQFYQARASEITWNKLYKREGM